MFGPTPFRDIFLVAGFELRDMLRSRRAILFATLYMIVAALGSYGFTEFLTRLQPIYNNPAAQRNRPQFFDNSAPTPSRPAPDATGISSDKPSQGRLFQRGSPFRGLLSGGVDEQAAVDFMASMPPITLFHMLISLMFMPLVIMITSSESISQEIQTRGVRFVGLRTGRGEFVLGKMLGQGFTIGVMTLLAGVVCMAIAKWKLADFELVPTVSALLLFWPRLLAYCAAFLGLAALCSMSASSTVASRVFSLVGLVFLWITNHFADLYLSTLPADSTQSKAWSVIQFLTPFSHQNNLWYPESARYGGAIAGLVFLGALYTALGLIFYRRRDL